VPLAYLCAKTYGLEDEAQAILSESGITSPPPIVGNGVLLKPPAPILKQFDSNWPQLTVSRGFFEGGGAVQSNNPIAAPIALDESALEETGDWGDDDDLDDDLEPKAPKKHLTNGHAAEPSVDEAEGEGWGDDDDLLLDDGDEFGDAQNGAVVEQFVAPTPGPSFSSVWLKNSQLAADHVAAGSFETAMQVRFEIPSLL
jgi:coatomer subunit alpha